MFNHIVRIHSIPKTLNNFGYFKVLNFKKFSTLKDQFIISEEIKQALNDNKPVVALESTIISHGMPYPSNVQTALEVESIVRENHCIPATIAIMEGKVHIGLDNNKLELLAKAGLNARKVSRRDLAFALSQKLIGATTVASTMLLAEKAGINIFVTGGIGGVHRGAEKTMDISADLTELGRTPVAVICAGAKSILDIGLTLEYLETQGVAVATLNEKSNKFPNFFTKESEFTSPIHFKSLDEAAEFWIAHKKMNLKSGAVIGVPIPDEYTLIGQEIQKAIEVAVKESQDNNIVGKEVTPYLLKRVNQLTKGQSLNANIALVKNNAKVGSKLAHLVQSKRHYSVKSTLIENQDKASNLLIIGGVGVDLVGSCKNNNNLLNTSVPGNVKMLLGGVATNLAITCHQLNTKLQLMTIIGDDIYGNFILNEFNKIGLNTNLIYKYKNEIDTNEIITPIYLAIHTSQGQLFSAIASHDLTETKLNSKLINKLINKILNQPKVVCFDGNLNSTTIQTILKYTNQLSIPTIFEPTSVPKSQRIFSGLERPLIASPNQYELKAMYESCFNKNINEDNLNLNQIKEFAIELSNEIPYLIVKLGEKGVFLVKNMNGIIEHAIIPPKFINFTPISVSGAGDSLVGSFASYLTYYLNQFQSNEMNFKFEFLKKLISDCQYASYLTLNSHKTVSEEINFDKIFVNKNDYFN